MEILYEIFPWEKLNDNGIYEICTFQDGQWQKVLVDDYLIMYKGTFAFTKPVNSCLYNFIYQAQNFNLIIIFMIF